MALMNADELLGGNSMKKSSETQSFVRFNMRAVSLQSSELTKLRDEGEGQRRSTDGFREHASHGKLTTVQELQRQ